MKKITAILLSVLMILGCASVMAVSAATPVATINVNGVDYQTSVGRTVTYTVNLQNAKKISNGEFGINYPQTLLEVSSLSFPLVQNMSLAYNYTQNRFNLISFNFSDANTENAADFTGGAVLATVSFKVKAEGTGYIYLTKEAMSSIEMVTIPNGNGENEEIPIIVDELPNATFTETFTGYGIDPETTISAKAAKSSIYVGSTTSVKATVKYGKGTTTFSSSNKSIATVTSKGVVKGVKAGTVKITAKNNGKSATATIKVVNKKANTLSVKGKTIKANSKKNTTFAKTKAFTIKNAKGTVTFKKASGDKKVSINAKTGKITVKKGLKKNKTYKVKFKVTAAGTSVYKAGSKTVTVNVKVK